MRSRTRTSRVATPPKQFNRSGGIVRVRTLLRRHKLDLRLAAGADPNLDPMSRQRALELLEPKARRRLAISLEELASPAEELPRLHGPAPRTGLPVASRTPFDTLVERLKAPAPVRAQGVARALLLITDGTGPLWAVCGEVDLSNAAEEALHGLDHGPTLHGFDRGPAYDCLGG